MFSTKGPIKISSKYCPRVQGRMASERKLFLLCLENQDKVSGKTRQEGVWILFSVKETELRNVSILHL